MIFRTVLAVRPKHVRRRYYCKKNSAEDIETLCDDLNEELANISEWMRSNKLSLNANKSEFLIVGHKRQLNGI